MKDYKFRAGVPGAPGAPGRRGERGAVFTPSIDDDGLLSWTNDGGLPNPANLNIALLTAAALHKTETLHGTTVHFEAPAAGLPLKKLTVSFTRTRSGSGTPSPENERPLIGHQGCTVYVSPDEDIASADEHVFDWDDLAGTIYAGELDVLAGTLTVTWTAVDMGEIRYFRNDSHPEHAFAFNAVGKKYTPGTYVEILADCYSYQAVGFDAISIGCIAPAQNSATGILRDTRFSTPEEVAAGLTGKLMYYPLANPVVYRLTKAEITTLLGDNYIWASDGETSVTHGGYANTGAVTKAYEVVAHNADLADSTAEYVLVLHNDSIYGDGGPCLFQSLSGKTRDGYLRAIGDRMFPVANIAPPAHTSPNRKALMDIIDDYLTSGLNYGQTTTLYSETCDDHIDCSSFVCAVLQGITYKNSRYFLGSEAQNIEGEYPDMLTSYDPAIGWNRYSVTFAQYFGEQKNLFELPTEPRKAAATLQFGDILFGSDPYNADMAKKYYDIGHVAFVLGTLPQYGIVLVCQAGNFTYPDGMQPPRDYPISQKTMNTTLITLTEELLTDYIRVFARPHYHDSGNQELVLADEYNLFWLLHMTFDANGRLVFEEDEGEMTDDCKKSYVTPDFYPAKPGETIHFEFQNTYNFTVHVYEYGSGKEFIRTTSVPGNEITLSAETYYVRFRVKQTNSTLVTKRINKFRASYTDIPFRIVKQPVNTTAVKNTTVTFTIDTNRKNVAYQWQYYFSSQWNDFASGNAASLSKTAQTSWNGWKIRCLCTATDDSTQIISDEVILTVTNG